MVYWQLKRKSDAADYDESNDRTTAPEYTEVVNSPIQTPAPVKAGKANKASRLSKFNRSGPQTPASNAGECY